MLKPRSSGPQCHWLLIKQQSQMQQPPTKAWNIWNETGLHRIFRRIPEFYWILLYQKEQNALYIYYICQYFDNSSQIPVKARCLLMWTKPFCHQLCTNSMFQPSGCFTIFHQAEDWLIHIIYTHIIHVVLVCLNIPETLKIIIIIQPVICLYLF